MFRRTFLKAVAVCLGIPSLAIAGGKKAPYFEDVLYKRLKPYEKMLVVGSHSTDAHTIMDADGNVKTHATCFITFYIPTNGKINEATMSKVRHALLEPIDGVRLKLGDDRVWNALTQRLSWSLYGRRRISVDWKLTPVE